MTKSVLGYPLQKNGKAHVLVPHVVELRNQLDPPLPPSRVILPDNSLSPAFPCPRARLLSLSSLTPLCASGYHPPSAPRFLDEDCLPAGNHGCSGFKFPPCVSRSCSNPPRRMGSMLTDAFLSALLGFLMIVFFGPNLLFGSPRPFCHRLSTSLFSIGVASFCPSRFCRVFTCRFLNLHDELLILKASPKVSLNTFGYSTFK